MEMPIHEYRCPACGHQWEELVPVTAVGAPECPECGSGEVRRLVSAAYVSHSPPRPAGRTCCGRTERCADPPCSGGDRCTR